MSKTSRRDFLKNASIATGLTTLTELGLLNHSCYFDQLLIVERDLYDDRFPSDYNLKIAFVTDFHTGCQGITLETLKKVTTQINGLNPDLILLGGDYENNTFFNRDWRNDPDPKPDHIASALSGFKTSKLGVYGVMGNHDWDKHGMVMSKALDHHGIQMIDNNVVTLSHKNVSFDLIGLPDYQTHFDLFNKATVENTRNCPSFVLGHDPYMLNFLPDDVVMAFFGHTHGRQIKKKFGMNIPHTMPTKNTPESWAYGDIMQPGIARAYVSSGIGHSRFPTRDMEQEAFVVTINPTARPKIWTPS